MTCIKAIDRNFFIGILTFDFFNRSVQFFKVGTFFDEDWSWKVGYFGWWKGVFFDRCKDFLSNNN